MKDDLIRKSRKEFEDMIELLCHNRINHTVITEFGNDEDDITLTIKVKVGKVTDVKIYYIYEVCDIVYCIQTIDKLTCNLTCMSKETIISKEETLVLLDIVGKEN